VSDFHPHVPKRSNEVAKAVLQVRIGDLGYQYHQVGVRGRVQFAAAITAHGHDSGALTRRAGGVTPESDDDGVHDRRPLGDQCRRRRALQETRCEGFIGLGQGAAEGLGDIGARRQTVIQIDQVQQLPVDGRGQWVSEGSVATSVISAQGQNVDPAFRDRHRVLPLSGQAVILGHYGPLVSQQASLRSAGVDHRLHRKGHAGL